MEVRKKVAITSVFPETWAAFGFRGHGKLRARRPSRPLLVDVLSRSGGDECSFKELDFRKALFACVGFRRSPVCRRAFHRNELNKQAQCRIDRFRVRKVIPYIRRQDDQALSGLYFLDFRRSVCSVDGDGESTFHGLMVPASDAFCKIIFLAHLIGILACCFGRYVLHIVFVLF